MTLVLFNEQPISLAEHEDLVSYQSAGTVVGFVGMICDHDDRRRVLRQEYSAHPLAAQVFTDVVIEVAEQPNEVHVVAVSHQDRCAAERRGRLGGRGLSRSSTGGIQHLRPSGQYH